MAYSENPSRVMVFPDGNSGNGNVPAWILPFMSGGFGNNGLFGGNNGWGGGILGFLLGLMFGRRGLGGLLGGDQGGGDAGAGFLSNQINNDSGRELLMNAIVSQGEQARTAIQTLSTMLGQDFNLVNNSIQTIQTAINQVANNQGLNAMQIINSIQNGNCTLGNQIAQCCCQIQNTVQQGFANTNSNIQQGFAGVQNQMAINQGQEELGRCQQTYTLTTNSNNNNQRVLDKLCEMQTQNLQDKLEKSRDENTVLRNQISQERQTQQFGAMLNATVAPIQARMQLMDDKIDNIAAKQPNTVPVTWPNLVAVQQNPYQQNFCCGGYNYGYGGYNDGFFN